jgi:hypothetical protein
VYHVRQQLEQVGGRVVGGVLNNLDPSAARYSPYHYAASYGGHYQEASVEAEGDGRYRSLANIWRR